MPAPASEQPLLSVRDLAVSFAAGGGGSAKNAPRLQAVDGVSMTIYPRQILAVVGESGCGKSVTALSLLHLLPLESARVDRGTAAFHAYRTPAVTPGPQVPQASTSPGVTAGVLCDLAPRDLLSLSECDIRSIRGRDIAMIFQEPMTSLNPVYSIGNQIIEAILLHQPVNHRQAKVIALGALRAVGITDPENRINAYPHQFSGGMRQRVMIAMALACKPSLLLADEPTTALDATIQQQILALLRDLKRDTGMAVMLITHDLGVVAENADVVCVMYAGRVVEYASVDDLFADPLHPYTRGLLACIPPSPPQARHDRLATIAETIDQPGAFDLPAPHSDLRPWWPWHTPPTGLTPRDSTLHEIRPNHWIALWRTATLTDSPTRPPDLNFRREPAPSDRSTLQPLLPCTP